MSGRDFPPDVVDEWRDDGAIIDWSLAVIGATPEPWDAVMKALGIDPGAPVVCSDTGETVSLPEAMRRLAAEGAFEVSIADEPARPFSSIYVWREQNWPVDTMTIELTFFPADCDFLQHRGSRERLLERAFAIAEQAKARFVLLYMGVGPSEYRCYESNDAGNWGRVLWRDGACTY